MVKSVLDKNINYSENKKLDPEDSDYDASLYEISILKENVIIALGQAKYKFIEEKIIYYPIYLVKDNKKSAIVDKAILDINFKDIEIEEDDANVLENLKYDVPVKVNEGTLIKIEGDNRVFVVDKDNKRHWVKNENTFNKLNYEWEDIKVVSKRVFKLQKHGAELDLAK